MCILNLRLPHRKSEKFHTLEYGYGKIVKEKEATIRQKSRKQPHKWIFNTSRKSLTRRHFSCMKPCVSLLNNVILSHNLSKLGMGLTKQRIVCANKNKKINTKLKNREKWDPNTEKRKIGSNMQRIETNTQNKRKKIYNKIIKILWNTGIRKPYPDLVSVRYNM